MNNQVSPNPNTPQYLGTPYPYLHSSASNAYAGQMIPQNQAVSPSMFQQCQPFQGGYPTLFPLSPFFVTGYQDVPMKDTNGLTVIVRLPIIDDIRRYYPPVQSVHSPQANAFCPTARPIVSAAVAPPATGDLSPAAAAASPPELLGSAAASSPATRDQSPTAAAASQLEDLKLSEDEVGLAIAPPFQEVAQVSAAVEEFFQPSCTQAPNARESFNFPEILAQYQARVATGDRRLYLPQRYQERINLVEKTQGVIRCDAWQDALLHNPPIEMLKTLDRMQVIHTTFQASSDKPILSCFLIPCTLSIPQGLRERYATDSTMIKLMNNKDRMVLELGLTPQGEPKHVFIRPLRDDETYLDKNLRENRQMVFTSLNNINYPALPSASRRVSASRRPQYPTEQTPVVETDTHLEFYCPDGVTIKAAKR